MIRLLQRLALTLAIAGQVTAAGQGIAGAADYDAVDTGIAMEAGIGARESFRPQRPGLDALRTGGVRIKDITTIKGVRDNQLVGYGLVIGLQGTGDTCATRPSPSSRCSRCSTGWASTCATMPRTKNVAAVVVTADLPPFIGHGSRIDVSVSSLGDAPSLMGGTLVMTPLYGPDGEIYAVAQGSLAVSGFTSQGEGETLTQGVPTSGRIPGGAHHRARGQARDFETDQITMELRNPDFAPRSASSTRSTPSAARYGKPVARENDLRTISLTRPTRSPRRASSPRSAISRSSRTSRPGGDRRAHRHGRDRQRRADLHGRRDPRQPDGADQRDAAGLAAGALLGRPDVVTSDTTVDAQQEGGNFAIVAGADLDTVVRGLNRLGLKPTGSSRSSRRSKPPAPFRPISWCNDMTEKTASLKPSVASSSRSLPCSCSRGRARRKARPTSRGKAEQPADTGPKQVRVIGQDGKPSSATRPSRAMSSATARPSPTQPRTRASPSRPSG